VSKAYDPSELGDELNRLELWRIAPPGTLPVCRLYAPRWWPVPWYPAWLVGPRSLEGWPVGYEWRRFDVSGREVGRYAVDEDQWGGVPTS
jgi:hypothetical protein